MKRYSSASLRTTTLLAIAVTLIGLLLLLWLASELVIVRSFRELEERTVRDDVAQTVSTLRDDIASLDRTTQDYAAWDDTYAFANDGNMEYVATNFPDETFASNRLSLVVVVNRHSDVIYMQAFDLNEEHELSAPIELTSLNGPAQRLLQHTSAESGVSGLVMLGGKPMLVAARPILTSAHTGPPNGTVIMGRALDPSEVARIANITGDNLTVVTAGTTSLTPDYALAQQLISHDNPIVTYILGADRIGGYAAMDDLLGSDRILLRIDVPRPIYQQGQVTIRYYLLALVLATTGFTAVVIRILNRQVLTRIISLSAQVARIGQSGDAYDRVVIDRNDEIFHLGASINTMLDDLARATKHLEQSESRYRQLIEIAPEPIVVHDGRQIRYINPAGAHLLGNDDPITCVGHSAAPFLAQGQQSAISNTMGPYECIFVKPDRHKVIIEFVSVPLVFQDEAAWQVVGRNITERKQTELALREAKETAAEANRAKSRFLANISHELRTPLTAIIGYAELIAVMGERGETHSLLTDVEKIRSAGRHLLALINDLLDLSKIDAGRMEFQVAPVVVHKLVDEVIDSVRPLATKRHNTLQIQIDPIIDTLYSDEMRVRQVLLNLVHNACKFTENGAIKLTVDRSAPATSALHDRSYAQVVFTISDTGIGMTDAQITGLFQDFVQADATTTRKYGGTGLGLALSQRLTRLLGGEITLTSKPGSGSTFVVTVPDLPASVTVGTVFATPATDLGKPLATAQAHDQIQFVLLIDDDAAMREFLPRAVARADLSFETAADGATGVTLARALLPDLIVLDVLLPDVDGWSVLTELKSSPDTASIPIILLTVEDHAQRGLLLGAAEFLTKPADMERLRQQVAGLLRKTSQATKDDCNKILIAEEDADVRENLRQIFEQDGYTVIEADNGQAALHRYRTQAPDAIVLDLMLPDMDGVQFVEALRATSAGETLPVVVVTTKELASNDRERLNRSMNQALHKETFRGEDLLQTVRTALVAFTPLDIDSKE